MCIRDSTKGLGAVHSMSHAVGARKDLRVHHGTLNGVILPTILRFNKAHVGNKYKKIAKAMNLNEDTDLAEAIEELNSEIGLPKNLKEMGVTEDMIPWLAEHSIGDPCTFTNPVMPTLDEYKELFVEALG